MTKVEVYERAGAIWGNVQDILEHPISGWYVITAAPPAGSDDLSVRHFLDHNGHSFCHPECAALEMNIGKSRASAGRPTLYPGKAKNRPTSFTLTEEASRLIKGFADQAGCTRSDFVQTLVMRHSLEALVYLQEQKQKGQRHADDGAGADARGGDDVVPADRRPR